jgi:hypothetical protein
MRRVLPAVLPLLTACYVYAPIEPAAVSPGTSVRARVSVAGAQRIAPLLGTADARVLDGTLVDVRPDTMIVQVPTVLQATVGSSRETLHQRLSIPRSDLLELETRKLDRTRTGIVAGSVALIVGTIVIRSLRNDPGREGPAGNNGGADARVPLAGFRF